MSDKISLYAVIFFVFVWFTATHFQQSMAEKPTPPVPCYEIYPQDRLNAVAMNKCTGDSWLLAKTELFDKGKDTNTFTYRWTPISSEAVEGQLSFKGQ